MAAPPNRKQANAETNNAPPTASPNAAGAAPPRAATAVGSLREDRTAVRELPHGARIVTANAGDHPLVLQLLTQARQTALAEDFQSRLDEPGYRPGNRLLVQRDKALLAHVHMTSHIAWFDGQRIPLARLEDYAVLPEYRESQYDGELLAAAESIAIAEGSILGLALTERPQWFERQGWSPLRGQGHTRASARAVLAHLDSQERSRRRRRSMIEVRTWRHFELDQVRTVYDAIAADLWGPLYRSAESWQWLLGRKAQDQILLAVSHAKASSPDDDGDSAMAPLPAAGYAVVRGSCIMEMMTMPICSSSRLQLLARACRDAIDRGHHLISLYTPAGDPLHELLVTAGGQWISDRQSNGPWLMVRLLSPQRWIERCYPLWRSRAIEGGVARPFELGVVAGETTYRLTLTRRSAKLEPARALPKNRIGCSRQTFESLLIGNLAVNAAVERGRLTAHPAALAGDLALLFAPRLFWQSPMELMKL